MRKFKLVNQSGYINTYILGNIYDEYYSYNSSSRSVLELSQIYPNDWQEIFQDTLESLTDQIKELAKKQGMKCEVVLEKKKEVDVFDFCAIYNQKHGITDLSVKIKNSSLPNVEAKQNEIIQAIKTILEND